MQVSRRHVEWRHLPAAWTRRVRPAGEFHVPVVEPRAPRAERLELELRLAAEPTFPGGVAPVARWRSIPTWTPACTAPLVRHRRFGVEEWTTTPSENPPEGFYPEHHLGLIHLRALAGTARVMRDSECGYVTVARGGEPTADEMAECIGYVDQVAFAMLEPLMLCRHLATGSPVLICGEDDPLYGAVELPPMATLGYVDRYPVSPRGVPASPESTAWLRGLLRSADPVARTHRMSIGSISHGERPWELGALLDRNPGDGIATWVDAEGRLHTENYSPTRHPYDLRRSLRWVAAPATWRRFQRRLARTRAVLRRGSEAARHTLAEARHRGATTGAQ